MHSCLSYACLMPTPALSRLKRAAAVMDTCWKLSLSHSLSLSTFLVRSLQAHDTGQGAAKTAECYMLVIEVKE